MSALHSSKLSRKYSFVIIGLFVVSLLPLRGQKVAVKTNLLVDATTTFNLGVELALHPKWTLDISGSYNPWTFRDNRKWQHWLVQPEARYWFCQKMSGHFLGFHVEGGAFNIGNLNVNMKLLGTDFRRLKDKRYEGWLAGGGIGYGYSWMVSRHWNIEAELGVGYHFVKYDAYQCAHCGSKLERNATHHYFGPTKAAINLIYNF